MKTKIIPDRSDDSEQSCWRTRVRPDNPTLPKKISRKAFPFITMLLLQIIPLITFSQVDFRQSANNDAGYGLGNVHWINSILQQSNSKYYEGMSSLQRVILRDITTTTGNVHTLTFRHQSIKNSAGSHAYDFLTSWPQAQAAANAIAPGQGLMVNLNQCGTEPSSDPSGILPLCDDLHSTEFTANPSIPDAMGSTLGDDVAARIAAYESQFGDRTLRMYGDAVISAASVTFNGYTGSDKDAGYTLTWTSSSSNMVIEFAGHLGVGLDPLLAGIGYGAGKGSGAIPGGPYHINLDLLDGHSLGNQDNQIKAADILIPLPPCNITGPDSSCTGATSLTYSGPAGVGLSYSWSLDPANGAVIVGSSTSASVVVSAAASTGDFTLKLAVTSAGGTTLCQKVVTIHALPACAINSALNSGGTATITCGSPGGSPGNTISTSNVDAGNTYAWSFLNAPAGWSITGGQGTNQITFTSGDCPLTSVTVQLIITSVNGCVSTCTTAITPTPFRVQCDAEAGDPKHLDCNVSSVILNGSTITPSVTVDNGTVYSSTYLWSGPGIVSNGTTLNPTVNKPGKYVLRVTVAPGTGVETYCMDSVLVTQDTVKPNCSITGVSPTCLTLSNNYIGPNAPAGKTYLYSWSLSGAVNASISGSSNSKTVTVLSGTCNAGYTLHLTVTDSANGCQSLCSESYGFNDSIAPSIGSAGTNTTINCPAEPVFTAPTASDACDQNPNVILVSDTTIGTACNYVRTKTWKAVDACGNESGLVSQAITVHDITAPVIGSAGTNTTINCPAEPVFTAPTATDVCDPNPEVILVSDTTIGTACNYVRTKTWKAVDTCGNESGLVSQSITVHDVAAPVIGSAGTNTTINCPAEPVFTAPTATDVCDPNPEVILVSDTTLGTACNYVRTKTWKAVDTCGNESGLVSQSITVHDVAAPVIGSAGTNTTINCPAEPVFTAPTATDVCDPSPEVILVSDTTIGTACNYVRTKTWKAVDTCGNESGLVSQSITVHDVATPVIGSAGTNTTINCPAEPVFTAPTATDVCDPSPEVILVSDTTIGTACNYVRTKTWKAVDACGNESGLVSQSITVHDITAPVIGSAGTNTTINCPAEPVFTAPTATDVCDPNPEVILVSDTTIGTACNYVRTKTWKAVDTCGNESGLVSQSITVHDVNAPRIGNPGGYATISCPSEPVFTAPTANDRCDPEPEVILVKDTTVVNACNYVRTKTWKAVDACGNESATVSQSITVEDRTAPSLNGEGADIVHTNCSAEVVFTAPVASDLCDPNPIVNLIGTDTVLNVDGSKTYTRRWNASDTCGNISEEVDQSITVPACRGEFCSLTQGFYGQNDANGKTCATGETAPELMHRLLSAPYGDLVIGKHGRKLIIKVNQESCVAKRLPAGGPSTMLPLGEQTFDAACNTTIPLKKGKFNNTLLGQTITLGFNIRYDANLAGLILTGTTLTTVGSNNGPDNICGTADDVQNNFVTTTKTIPASVIVALMANYGNTPSVLNLFDLANRALGGMSTYGASLSEINTAVSAINEAFDNCQFLATFSNRKFAVDEEQAGGKTNDLLMKAYPNPFESSSIIEFISKTDATLSVEVYSITGAKVVSLFNGNVKAGEANSVIFKAADLPNGSYICKIVANGNVYVEKLVLIR